MLEQLDGTAQYDDDDHRRRELAHNIHESRQAYGSAVLARDFLRKYPDYLT
jgi:hypothetical protein